MEDLEKNKNYYEKKGNKTVDIVLGIVSAIAYLILSLILFFNVNFFQEEGWITLVFPPLLAIALAYCLNRKYIAIGIIAIILIPLLIFGGCLMIISY